MTNHTVCVIFMFIDIITLYQTDPDSLLICVLLKYFALVYTGDQILSATVYFDNVSYEDAIQILEHAQAYRVKLCLKRKPDITETETATESDVIPVTIFKLSDSL